MDLLISMATVATLAGAFAWLALNPHPVARALVIAPVVPLLIAGALVAALTRSWRAPSRPGAPGRPSARAPLPRHPRTSPRPS